MKSLLVLSFLCSVQLVVSRCPSGTVQGLNDQDCYFYSATPASWVKAEEACIRRNGHLASVSSALSNSVLRQVAGLSCQEEFWLGGSYDTEIPNQWSWTDERRFSYKNWAAGQPTNQDSYCTALDVSTGRWYSRACSTAKPFVCKVPPSGAPSVSTTSAPRQRSTTATPRTTCPRGWTYVAGAGKCLKMTESRDSWSNTWGKCKELGGDLVSIPNNATNYALVDFAFRSLSMQDDDYNWVAIGLHKPTENDPWQWTDGSPVSFTSWEAGYSDEPAATLAFMGLYGQQRVDWEATNGHWEGAAEFSDFDFWWGICECNAS